MGTALLGAGILLLVWNLSAIAVALIIAGLSWASFKRSRPARVDSMSMLDSGGFGVSYSPEVLHYIARGALGLGVAALALGYLSEAEFDSWVRPEQMVGSMKAGR